MAKRSMSDIIEEYLKNVLNEKTQIEIRRNEMAELFDCVPSQINYVINTRFTLQQGYIVESKRGGGGYIRIKEVKLLDESDKLDTMIDTIGNHISERNAVGLIKRLYSEEIVTRPEAKLMLAGMDSSLYEGLTKSSEEVLRARLLKNFLLNLKYD